MITESKTASDNDLLTVKQASIWASEYLKKNVTTSNISYLIQYGRVRKIGDNGSAQISKNELMRYYNSFKGKREVNWKQQLGEDLNWALSFDHLKEADTTKHVHRLHPYKGKFIPQLVEYFLDNHTDEFKKQTYFQKDDIILDPFCGSGTTLVQANELGMHGIGIDVSAFNSLIANSKVTKYNIPELKKYISDISVKLNDYLLNSHTIEFEQELLAELKIFNDRYFPVPEFKYKVKQKLIDGDSYGEEKALEFLPIYQNLVKKYKIELIDPIGKNFLEKWYTKSIRAELNFVFDEIKKIESKPKKKLLSLILSRTMRSCRATTHADLATLKEPVTTTYYCAKHGKICKPIFSILKWWETYSKDTIKRLEMFGRLRTGTYQCCLPGDSRTINLFDKLEEIQPAFAEIAKRDKIKGIFSSPPYVGLIDYHEQHAYAYDLFGFHRNDELEIGPLCKGQGKAAKESYVRGISDVLTNCKRFLADDYDVFLVANDKYGLYPTIAKNAGMKIVNQHKRPVLNRTERDKAAYSEIIFHLKEI